MTLLHHPNLAETNIPQHTSGWGIMVYLSLFVLFYLALTLFTCKWFANRYISCTGKKYSQYRF